MNRIYTKTIGRSPWIHCAVRRVAWAAGDAVVATLSHLTGFELPQDKLLPFIKLPLLLGVYERDCAKVFRRLIAPGMTVIDAGAHAGYFTLLFSKLVGPGGKVVAIEPHPTTFEVLKGNMKRRNVSNVVLVQKAVQDRETNITLYVTALSYGNTIFPVKDYHEAINVPGSTIESIANALALPRVDFVKLDVEGAELEALHGLGRYARPGISAMLENQALHCRGQRSLQGRVPPATVRDGLRGFPHRDKRRVVFYSGRRSPLGG